MSNGAPVPLCVAREVRKTYLLGRSTVEVLRGVTVEIREGESVAITGASGAGKSTLIHTLGGLDQPTSGQVTFAGEDVYAMKAARRNRMRATEIGFVFQAFHLLPELEVLDNVLLPAMAQGRFLSKIKESRAEAADLLEKVGLGHRLHHRPLELSGGEQQRVAIARALMNRPKVVFADEPTGNLDSKTGGQVLDYLFDLTRVRGHTLVLVTHNEALAGLCTRTLVLTDGRLADPVV